MITSSETSTTSSTYTDSEENENCTKCCAVTYLDFENSDFFILHTRRQILKERLRDSKKQKKALLDSILKRVTALRNTNGGKLVIHIEGQRSGDKYLEFFDESISYQLLSLLHDGQLYVDAFSRGWLSDFYKDYYDFVILHVAKGERLTTVDFNTKVVTDNELGSPSSLNIAQLMKKSIVMKQNTNPMIRGLENLHESRHVQLKAFQPNLPKHKDFLFNVETLTDYLWRDLRLKHYITAFSKVENGGSFFVGITETRHDFKDGYRTNTSDVVGFCVNDPEKIIEHINSKVKENLVILDHEGLFLDFPSDHISCEFHEVIDTSPQRFVLEVSVGFVKGIVFCERDGPRSYHIVDGKVARMTRTEWLDKFKASYIINKI